MDTLGYVQYVEAQKHRWWVRFRPHACCERFAHEVDHLYAMLGESLQPIRSLKWCIGSKVDMNDLELSYYAVVAMEMCD